MKALEVTYLFSEIMGLLVGIFCIAVLINFLIKKATHKESLGQKYIAVLLSAVLYAILPLRILNLTDPFDIAGQIFFSFLCGILVCYFMRKALSLKKFMLFELFGSLGFIVLGFIWILLLRDNYRSIIGTVDFVISFLISGIVIFRKQNRAIAK